MRRTSDALNSSVNDDLKPQQTLMEWNSPPAETTFPHRCLHLHQSHPDKDTCKRIKISTLSLVVYKLLLLLMFCLREHKTCRKVSPSFAATCRNPPQCCGAEGRGLYGSGWRTKPPAPASKRRKSSASHRAHECWTAPAGGQTAQLNTLNTEYWC